MEVLQRVMLTDLTDRQRIALEAELEGMNRVPLAEKLGTNPNALYKLVHDARKRLRAALDREGITLDDVREIVFGAS